MRVLAFVGESGTGKSYQATWVARQYGVEAIIDDGLLVCGNKVLAGFSAKREPTRIASIRRALFTDADHTNEVKKAIIERNPSSVLILGTSDNMVRAIAKRLELGEIEKIIRIEEISSKEDIKKAVSIRRTQGKHIIPVPTFEIKKDFSGYFLDSMQVLFKGRRNAPVFVGNKSVVRPTFSYLGEYHIANNVISTICVYEAQKIQGLHRVVRTSVDPVSDGVEIELEIIAEFGVNIPKCASFVQRCVLNAVENFTSINVCRVDILVKSLYYKGVLK